MQGRRVGVMLVAALLLAGCGGAGATPEDEPPRLGLLRIVHDPNHGVFVEELRRQGFRVGSDVHLLPSDPGELYDDVEEARTALGGWLRDDLDLVVAFSTPFAQLVSGLETGVPGLFVVNDPMAAGLVGDLNRPEGSMTGVTFRTPADRTLALAAEALGELTRVGYLWPEHDPAVPGHREGVVRAAEELGIELVERSFETPQDVAAAVDELVAAGVQAVAVANSNATFRAVEELRVALDGARIPVIANTEVVDFAVVVLAPDGAELRRQLARQAARLLSGTEVSSIPVEDPRKFTLVVNRTKAVELGLPPLPDGLLRQADVVR